MLEFVEQVGLLAQQQLVAGAGVEGEQGESTLMHALVGGLSHAVGKGGGTDGLGDERLELAVAEQDYFSIVYGRKRQWAWGLREERVVVEQEEILESCIRIMELKIPGVLLAGGVDEERARFAGHHEGDVCAHAAGLKNGVAGWIFFRGEYLLQLVQLGRAEVAVVLQEADKKVHGRAKLGDRL